jgi:hypothetical protein
LNADLLFAQEKISQDHEHHEEHDNKDNAPEEKAEEFGWGWARQSKLP